MIQVLSSLLCIVFLMLSATHFYWAFGGKWGIDSVLPSNDVGAKVLKTNALATIIVGVGLLSFALFYLVKTGFLSINLPSWLLLYAGWILPLIFLFRVVGDFKYVGLFKKIKTTKFAISDTKYFIPICSFLAVAGFIIQTYTSYEA